MTTDWMTQIQAFDLDAEPLDLSNPDAIVDIIREMFKELPRARQTDLFNQLKELLT